MILPSRLVRQTLLIVAAGFFAVCHSQEDLKRESSSKTIGSATSHEAAKTPTSTTILHRSDNNQISVTNGSLTNRLDNNNKNTTNFGDHQASASIFRPALLENLFNRRTKKASPEKQDDEEEVTQTIELPITNEAQSPDDDNSDSEKNSNSESSSPSSSNDEKDTIDSLASTLGYRDPTSPMKIRSRDKNVNKNMNNNMKFNARAIAMLLQHRRQAQLNARSIQARQQHHNNRRRQLTANLKPEASFRLSNTEMDGILHDREAPEAYKSRELHGDGVLVGEEPTNPRMGTSASNHYASGSGAFETPMMPDGAHLGLGYGASEGGPALEGLGGSGRLINAASEDYPGPGFSHRLGAAAFGSEGRLMQSPNEYNEMSSYPTASSALYGSAGAGHEAGGDYGQSGLLRASTSGAEYNQAGGNSFYGNSEIGLNQAAAAEAASYPGSPMLDRHPSEHGQGLGYGEAGAVGSIGSVDPYYPGPGLGASAQHRLMSAGSHSTDDIPTEHMSSYGPSPMSSSYGAEETTSSHRYPPHLPQPDELALQERGFGFMGMHPSIQQRSGYTEPSPNSHSGLMPLNPVLPTAEDIGATATEIDHYSRASHRHSMMARSSNSQNPSNSLSSNTKIFDDSNDSDSTPESQMNQQEQREHQQQDQRRFVSQSQAQQDDENESESASNRDDEKRQVNGPLEYTESEQPPEQHQHERPVPRPSIEFSRAGSAGYLAPNRFMKHQDERQKKLTKKSSLNFGSSYDDPAQNPAHEGKYIID